MHEGALLQRLQSLKDLFLMGKGHLFQVCFDLHYWFELMIGSGVNLQNFIDETRELMRRPPKVVAI